MLSERKREQHKLYIRNRYQTDPEYRERHKTLVVARKKKVQIERRILIEEFKSGGCRICNESEICCLVAHHLDPQAKDFNLSEASKHGFSTKRVVDELSKCVCLCENCHRKVHAGKLQLAE